MIATLDEWNEFLKNYPEAHLLQTGAWGELKSLFGWKAIRVISGQNGTQILFRSIPGGFRIGYIPKGPLGGINGDFLKEIDQVGRENRAIFIKLEPDIWEGQNSNDELKNAGWQSARTIQPRRTILIPVLDSEENILAGMKQKTRYNVHLAEKKGITVGASTDFAAFQKMMLITGTRDKIGIHKQAYYQRAYDLFHSQGHCDLLFAYFDKEPIAAIMVFAYGKRAWYMYGASTENERNRMPTYLLQWEAIRWAKNKGCEEYDLWGIPDLEEDELEAAFTKKVSHEGLWGVYRFKRGFGGKIARTAGAWDRVYFPNLYNIYSQIMKIRGRQED
jgi:peptidoglycan pentaglycine glycine transferase (the first glycine)